MTKAVKPAVLAALAFGTWTQAAAAQGSCEIPTSSTTPAQNTSSYGGPGDTTGSTPAPAAPNTPAPATPGPGKPPGFGGRPESPRGGAPGPFDPNSPYTLDGEPIEDVTAWQLWWEFNKDAYLRLGGIHTGVVKTAGEDFYLGKGQSGEQIGGRAKPQTVDAKIVPALQKAIEGGGSIEYVQGAMLAVAKIGGANPRHPERKAFDFVLEYFLKEGGDTINRTAAVALGVLADGGNVELLTEIAKGTEAGCKATGRETIDAPLRAFAAYGLGFVGRGSTDAALRSGVIRTLIDLLEDPESARDVRAAAMIAIGLVPLELEAKANVCICGSCKVAGPETSLQNQITYLMRYFTADRVYDPIVRAHTATTLARLIEPRASELRIIKEAVTDFLIASLEKSARQPAIVRQSSVLALGLLGDSDQDSVDRWIRWALNRAAGHGDPLERRYALIALGQIGSRGGQGETAWTGTQEVRKDLLHHLSRGKKNVKPWAGLGLGVLGHGLAERGQERSSAPDLALRGAMRTARTASDLGAYAIACGLRGDQTAAETLLAKLKKARGEDARSYVALGLGLMGAREAIEPLQGLLVEAEEEPLLTSRVAIALGLLGDTQLVPHLLERLEKTEVETTRGAVASALGFIGDERSVDRLVALMLDDERSDETRERAVRALGFAADPAYVPWRAALARNANYRASTPTLTSSERGGVLDIE
ncbi:MAG: hypothetical protein GY711_12285 [bacterium]|nr:hypothetical protein [bacterium]